MTGAFHLHITDFQVTGTEIPLFPQQTPTTPASPWIWQSEVSSPAFPRLLPQGDKEAELGLPFSPLCDRTSTLVAQSQIGEYPFRQGERITKGKECCPGLGQDCPKQPALKTSIPIEASLPSRAWGPGWKARGCDGGEKFSGVTKTSSQRLPPLGTF